MIDKDLQRDEQTVAIPVKYRGLHCDGVDHPVDLIDLMLFTAQIRGTALGMQEYKVWQRIRDLLFIDTS